MDGVRRGADTTGLERERESEVAFLFLLMHEER